MKDKLCNCINDFIKDEVNGVLMYTDALNSIEMHPDIANITIAVDENIGCIGNIGNIDKGIEKSNSISILEVLHHILKQEVSHVFMLKAIGNVLHCPEPVMTKDEAEKIGETLENIGEKLERGG